MVLIYVKKGEIIPKFGQSLSKIPTSEPKMNTGKT
jgi:hypothetical protein